MVVGDRWEHDRDRRMMAMGTGAQWVWEHDSSGDRGGDRSTMVMGTGAQRQRECGGERRLMGMGARWRKEWEHNGNSHHKTSKKRFVSKLHPSLPLTRAFLPLRGPFFGAFPPALRAGARGACRRRADSHAAAPRHVLAKEVGSQPGRARHPGRSQRAVLGAATWVSLILQTDRDEPNHSEIKATSC